MLMQTRARKRPKTLNNRASIRLIVGLLVLLIALFYSGMVLLSHLNLSYSQKAMAELRRDQIEDVFFASLSRIDARQLALQQQTSTLSILGETFSRLASSPAKQVEPAVLRSQLETALGDHLSDFEGAFSAGIWFEPGILAKPGETYAPYLTKAGAESAPGRLTRPGRPESYQEEPWFELTLGDDWTADKVQDRIYWSPVYFDFGSQRAVFTLVSPMFGVDGSLVGVVTTGWASDQVIDFVSRVEVTENSFSFLNDRNNRNLSSLSRGDDIVLEQKIIDAILARSLPEKLQAEEAAPVAAKIQPERLHSDVLEVDGRLYELYYAATPAGMVYGAGVPRDEINRVLIPMRTTNHRILFTTGSVLLAISAFLFFRIVQLMRELRASYTDVLTGLPNRGKLLKDLNSRAGACLIIINIDRFQETNTLFGNACGDQVLLTLAAQLQHFCETHLATWGARVYRLRGDEFALLGPALTESRVRNFANNLSEFLHHQRVLWKNQSLGVDATVGIAFRQDNEKRAARDQLLSQATIALRQAREQMRNYLIYDARGQVEKDYEKNLYWAQRLKDALERDEIVPHFQPIYDNNLGRITKYECLVRMLDGDDVISAGHFIGIANRLRLDRQLTCIMLEKSFARFAQEPYEFSINLSYADLVEPIVLELILKYLRESAIGHRVIFEILESDGIENYAAVLNFIEQVKAFGCQIAIDDFGTGYSNFEQLLRLNVDIIKIDGSLIQHLDEDPTARAVTRGIVQFARTLGIRTVAEFVRNEAVQAHVTELGIDFSQGEYFSMPGPYLIPSEALVPVAPVPEGASDIDRS